MEKFKSIAKKILFFKVIWLAFLFFPHNASAAILVGQPDLSTRLGASFQNHGDPVPVTFGTSTTFTGVTGIPKSIYIAFDNDRGLSKTCIYIRIIDHDNAHTLFSDGTIGQTSACSALGSGGFENNTSAGINIVGVPLDNGSDYSLTAADHYSIEIGLYSPSPNFDFIHYELMGEATTSFSDGFATRHADPLFYALTDATALIPPYTHIIATTPLDGETVATSTSFTLGATGYITDDDIGDGVDVTVSWKKRLLTRLCGAGDGQLAAAICSAPPPYIGSFTEHITSSGNFSISSTTNIQDIGQYILDTKINKNISHLYGLYYSSDTLDATSTYFIVATSTAADLALGKQITALQQLGNDISDGFDWNVCNPLALFNSFSPEKCMVLLFLPTPEMYKNVFDTLHNGTLTHLPWGYATRVVAIMTSPATSTLPTFTLALGTGPLASTTGMAIDMNDIIAGGGNLLNSIHDPISGKTAKDIMLPWVQLTVALSVLFIIVSDLLAMGHHTEPKHNAKNT